MGLAAFKFEPASAELLCVDCETTYMPRGESTACPYCGGTCAVAMAGPRMPLSRADDEARLVRIEATIAEDVIVPADA
jgi:Zn finger protein HypA/HybF involved in hydrogenase expression